MNTPITNAASLGSDGGSLPPFVVDAQICKKLELELLSLKEGLAHFTSLSQTEDGINSAIELNPVLREVIVKCLASMVADSPNYTECQLSMRDDEHNRINVVIQKTDGESPHQLRQKAEKEVTRLKAGDFTPEEFQNLCHKFDEKDKKAFCYGCEQYQQKLFGKSPISDLKEELDKYKQALQKIAQCNHLDTVSFNGVTRNRAALIAERALRHLLDTQPTTV